MMIMMEMVAATAAGKVVRWGCGLRGNKDNGNEIEMVDMWWRWHSVVIVAAGVAGMGWPEVGRKKERRRKTFGGEEVMMIMMEMVAATATGNVVRWWCGLRGDEDDGDMIETVDLR
nr:hypothetical protein [Tanacetum cinerariifolium]